jgi:hypothetical protein
MISIETITFAIAVLGAALGLINTWHNLDKSRIKLVVVPKRAIPVGPIGEDLTFCVEVTNLSSFAVTVYDVGVFYKGTEKRGSIIQPIIIDGGPWPRRLEPRSSVTAYSKKPTSSEGHTIKCAYAKTECGHIKTGNSPALKQLAKEP